MPISSLNIAGAILISLLIILIAAINTIKYGKPIRDLFEPITFFAIFLGAFFVFNFLFINYEFSAGTISIVFLGSLFFIVGYYNNLARILSRFFNKLFSYGTMKVPTKTTLIFFSIIFIILWVIIMLLRLKYYSTSLSEFFASTITFHAQTKMGGYIFYPFFTLFTMLFYFFIYSFLEKKQRISALVLTSILIILFNIVTVGSGRWDIIAGVFLTPLLLYQLFIIKKPSFNPKVLVIFLLIPFLLIVFNEFRHRGLESISTITNSELIETSLSSLQGDTNPSRNLDMLYRYIDERGDYHYGWYFVSQFVSLVPRIVWEGKPITSLPFAYTKKIYDIDPVEDITTYTFTIFDSYAWFGWGTLFFVSFLTGIFSNAVYRSMWNRNVFFLLFGVSFILGFLPMIRGSFIDMIPFYVIQFIVIAFLYFVFKLMGVIKIKDYGK